MLKAGGIINIIIAIAHIGSLFCLQWAFENTGVAEEMGKWADINPIIPYILTGVVTVIFFVMGLYGLSGAGIIRKLPLLKLGVFTIAGVYLLRGVGGLIYELLQSKIWMNEIVFSLVATAIGLLYLLGGLKKWCKN